MTADRPAPHPPRIDVRRTPAAVLVEVDAGPGGLLPAAWLARWRTAVSAAHRHPDDLAADDGDSYVAARVRTRRATPLLDHAAEIGATTQTPDGQV